VKEFGISDEKNDPMCVKNLAEFGAGAVKHQDPDVWRLVKTWWSSCTRQIIRQSGGRWLRTTVTPGGAEEMDRYERKIRKNR
jgi:hypothetical protein